MKKIIVLISFLGMFSSGTLFSQTDKFMFHGGFTYDFYTVRPKYSSPTEGFLLPFYGLTAGLNYVLLHSNDQISLCANPNASFAFSGGSGLSLMAQAPIFLLARYGAGATPYNEKKIGIGVGAGGTLNYLYSNGFLPNLNHTFVFPSAVGEVTINGRSSFYSLRLHMNLARAIVKWANTDYTFSNLGFSVNYSF